MSNTFHDFPHQRAGKIPTPSRQMLSHWIAAAWASIPEAVIVKSFRKANPYLFSTGDSGEDDSESEGFVSDSEDEDDDCNMFRTPPAFRSYNDPLAESWDEEMADLTLEDSDSQSQEDCMSSEDD